MLFCFGFSLGCVVLEIQMNLILWLHGSQITQILKHKDQSCGRRPHWLTGFSTKAQTDSPFFLTFCFSRWPRALCNGQICCKEHWKHTSQQQLEVNFNGRKMENKKHSTACVTTLFSLGWCRPPTKINVPVCVHGRCTYCGLQVNGHSTQCQMDE